MRKSEETLSITKTVKNGLKNPASFSFICKIKNTILGRNYRLSMVFIGDKKSKSLNLAYRQKNKPTDILSFPLSKKEGEIFINPKQLKIKAKKFGRKEDNFFLFLFIHGLCHLKGMRHGSRMEREEQKYREIFKV